MKPMITCRVLISRVDVNRTTTYKTLKTPLTRGLTHFATRPTRCLPGRQYHCYCCPQLALDCCNSPHLIFAYIHSFTLETVDTWMLRNGGERSSVGYSQGPGQPVGHSGIKTSIGLRKTQDYANVKEEIPRKSRQISIMRSSGRV